ncbi:hypothetical protein MMC26_004443 [Xylographa opegraphella]|nr:hypothetical protein [Xylographa opegraphella]
MSYPPAVYRMAIDLLVAGTISAHYITAHRSWPSFRFLRLQSPVQFKFLLLGVCLLYTCLRCALVLVLHHSMLTGIYTYLFITGAPHGMPTPVDYPILVVPLCATAFLYAAKWLKSGLVMNGRVRATEFRPSKLFRPIEYWLVSRWARRREARLSAQRDLEDRPPARELQARCASCDFLFENAYARRTVACMDLASIVVLTALLDLYLANRNGWVIDRISALAVLFCDIVGWESFCVLFWFIWVDTLVTSVEAGFEWRVADRCRRKKMAGMAVRTDGSLGGK